jgi:hypothetical protein
MSRPKGSKNKTNVHHDDEKEAVHSHEVKETIKQDQPVNLIEPIAEKVVEAVLNPKVLEPLSDGQAYFEAPDGTIIIGDDSRDQVWYRQMNKGKGGWINKQR